MYPTTHTFPNGQIVALRGIASIGPIQRDYTFQGPGRAYFEIQYQAGAIVTVPKGVNSQLDPPMTDDEVSYAHGVLRRTVT